MLSLFTVQGYAGKQVGAWGGRKEVVEWLSSLQQLKWWNQVKKHKIIQGVLFHLLTRCFSCTSFTFELVVASHPPQATGRLGRVSDSSLPKWFCSLIKFPETKNKYNKDGSSRVEVSRSTHKNYLSCLRSSVML